MQNKKGAVLESCARMLKTAVFDRTYHLTLTGELLCCMCLFEIAKAAATIKQILTIYNTQQMQHFSRIFLPVD